MDKPYCYAVFLDGGSLAFPQVEDAALAWELAEASEMGTVKVVYKVSPHDKYPGFYFKEARFHG